MRPAWLCVVLFVAQLSLGVARPAQRGSEIKPTEPAAPPSNRSATPLDKVSPRLTTRSKKDAARVHTRAYNCTAEGSSTVPIDLTKPGKCLDPTRDFETPLLVQAAIVRETRALSWKVWHCSFTVTRTVTACGFDSLTYGSQTTQFKDTIFLEEDECKEAVTKRQLNFEGHTVRLGENSALPTRARFFTKGYVYPDGRCDTWSHYQSHKTFITVDSYEQVEIHLLARLILGQWEVSQGQIDVDEQLTGPFGAGQLLDEEKGAYYWQTARERRPELLCKERVERIFRGQSKLYRRTSHDRRGATTYQGVTDGSLLLIEPPNKDQAMAVVLGEPIRLCDGDEQCYRADNLPGFSVCIAPTMQGAEIAGQYHHFLDKQEVTTSNGTAISHRIRNLVDAKEWERAVTWSHADFLHLSNNLRIHSTIEGLMTDICRVERLTLFNKLQGVSSGGNPHAFANILGEGHQVTVVGPLVAYVTKCMPVDVTLEDHNNCTVEVPVRATGEPDSPLRFMEPLTKILLDYPTEVVCSSLLPVRWLIEGRWYCSQPDLVPCAEPKKLQPSTGAYHTRLDFVEDTRKANLARPSQLAERDRLISRANHREAVLARVVSNSLNTAGNGAVGSVFSQQDLDALTVRSRNAVLGWLNPWFLVETVGLWWWRIFSFLSFLTVIMAIGAALARCGYQFAAYGWDGGRTLGKAFLALWGIVYIPKHMIKYVLGRTQEELKAVGAVLRRAYQAEEDDSDESGSSTAPQPKTPEDDPEGPAGGPAPPRYKARTSPRYRVPQLPVPTYPGLPAWPAWPTWKKPSPTPTEKAEPTGGATSKTRKAATSQRSSAKQARYSDERPVEFSRESNLLSDVPMPGLTATAPTHTDAP